MHVIDFALFLIDLQSVLVRQRTASANGHQGFSRIKRFKLKFKHV
jgi:hypothetical protein